MKGPEQLSEQQTDKGLYSGTLPPICSTLLIQQFRKLCGLTIILANLLNMHHSFLLPRAFSHLLSLL